MTGWREKFFYSFHYQPDNWRASQVRNIGVIEGNQPASDHDWETVEHGGDVSIQRWIDNQLSGRTCTIVLIGAQTASLFSLNPLNPASIRAQGKRLSIAEYTASPPLLDSATRLIGARRRARSVMIHLITDDDKKKPR